MADPPAAVAVQGSVTDNEAALQFRVTKDEQPFLATQPDPGQAGFLTFMKPCSILLPHTHPRATEFYQILFGALRCYGLAMGNVLKACKRCALSGAAHLHGKVHEWSHLCGTWPPKHDMFAPLQAQRHHYNASRILMPQPRMQAQ